MKVGEGIIFIDVWGEEVFIIGVMWEKGRLIRDDVRKIMEGERVDYMGF